MTANRRIAAGQLAPDFTAPGLYQKTYALSQFRGQRVWLAFFRYAGCPLCNLRVSEMVKRRADFERYNLAILAVFQSPPERLAKYVGKQEPQFPLLSDPEEKLYALYGLETSVAKFLAPTVLPKLAKAMAAGFLPGATDGSKTRVPADFLVDENGMVADAFYGRDIADHIPFERVERFMTAGR